MVPKVFYFHIRTSFIVLIINLLFVIAGCGGESVKHTDSLSELSVNDSLNSNVIKLGGKAYGVPSVVQFSEFLKQNTTKDFSGLINNHENGSVYTSTLKQALNLGIYTADYTYLIVHGNYPEADRVMNAVKTILDNLNFHPINQSQLSTKISSTQNADSLLTSVSQNITAIQNYLAENNRTDVASLMLSGAWIEAMYLMTNQQGDSIMTADFMAEQKYTLDNIISLLKPYYGNSADFDSFLDALLDLAYLYDGITYSYDYLPPVTNADKRHTHVVSKIKYNSEQYHTNTIEEKVKQLRNKIVSVKNV